MRIIITSKGEIEQRELEETIEKKRNKTVPYSKLFRRTFTINKTKNTFSKSKANENDMRKTTISTLNKYSPFSTESSFNNSTSGKSTLKRAKKIRLKLAKLSFTKRIADNYENDKATTEKIIDNPNNSPDLSRLKHYHKKNEKYTLGEILGKDMVFKLKKNLIQEEKMKDKLSRIDENNFRSTYQNFTKLEKLDQILKYKKIPPTNINLIRFINEKKDIQKNSLQKIIQFDGDQMFTANKICQTVFYNEEQEKVLNEVINKKIKSRHNQEKVKCDEKLNKMKEEIESSKRIFDLYSNRVDKMEKYREKHSDIEKLYWEKYHVNNLCRKTRQRQSKMLETQ